jgi:outer membrane lipoprotein-sorting protein
MRWTIRLALLMLVLHSAPAQTQADVGQILKKVDETYRAATEYEVVLDATGREEGKDVAMHALLAFRAPSKYRTEGAFPGMEELIEVYDGVTLWIYSPKENQYWSIPHDQITPAPGNLGEGPEFLMSGIRSIASQAANGKLVREGNLVIGGSDTACYVIEVTLEGQPETLWVDKKRHVIVRTETADAKVTFTTVKLNQPLPDELFKFNPPPGATRAERPR